MREFTILIGICTSERYGNEFDMKCYCIMLFTAYTVCDEVYAFTLLANCVGG